MPYLERFELSGSSSDQNLDDGHQLKQLFEYIQEVQLDNLEFLTAFFVVAEMTELSCTKDRMFNLSIRAIRILAISTLYL